MMVTVAAHSGTAFGRYLESVMQGTPAVRDAGSRDLLPLPAVSVEDDVVPYWWPADAQNIMVGLISASAVGLNFLHGGCRPRAVPPRLSSTQRQALMRVGMMWWRTARQLQAADWEEADGAFAKMAARASGSRFTDLRAERVDLAPCCGQVDPLECMDEELRQAVSSPGLVPEESVAALPSVASGFVKRTTSLDQCEFGFCVVSIPGTPI